MYLIDYIAYGLHYHDFRVYPRLDVNNIDAGLNIGTSAYLTEHLDIELNLYIGMIGLENQDDGYNKALKSTSFSLGYTF